jgi:hypothetical protein
VLELSCSTKASQPEAAQQELWQKLAFCRLLSVLGLTSRLDKFPLPERVVSGKRVQAPPVHASWRC